MVGRQDWIDESVCGVELTNYTVMFLGVAWSRSVMGVRGGKALTYYTRNDADYSSFVTCHLCTH